VSARATHSGCCVVRRPFIFFFLSCVMSGVCVNTTDATTGATAMLLPAQNTHTSHDPNETRSMRARCALAAFEDGLGVVWSLVRFFFLVSPAHQQHSTIKKSSSQ
jgi:hypothetical protein